MSKKVVTFGEIMLRLSPPEHQRFTQADSFEIVYGGGEANVAVSAANYGLDAAFVTKLPDNAIGDSAINELRRYGVDTNFIARGGDRIGIYYYEKGASVRPSKVIYDRAYSAIAEAKPGDIDWKGAFEGATWFHFTGITPALGEDVAKLTEEGCKVAKEMGLTVSCDLNYRKKLWTTEEAGKTMGELMKYVDVIVANEEDAEKVFGIKAAKTDVTSGELDMEGYKYVAKELKERFDLEIVTITLRESISASDNNWSAMLYDGNEYLFSKKYNLHIVDRVGGGDSFGGGLIYSLVSGYGHRDALEFAVAASALKHTIIGDANHVSVEEVNNLKDGDASGRVQR
ncbi:MAG: sugar kinase [Clostridiales bacterium]|nr:sugar kinase [Clostridiales bacterium]